MVVPRTKFGWGNNRGAASGQNSVVLQEAVTMNPATMSDMLGWI